MMGGGDGWGILRESVFSISSLMHLSFVTDDCLQIVPAIAISLSLAGETTILLS